MIFPQTLRIIAAALFLAAALAFAPGRIALAEGHDLVIFHTNDVHGFAYGETDQDGKLTKIGYDRLKAVVDAEPSSRKLLLDAGDVLHGSAFAAASRGELPAILLSLAGYDALAVGNHDFGYGWERLSYLIGKYRLSFLAANVKSASPDNTFSVPGSLIRDFGDLKAGVFGLSTPETPSATTPKNVAGLEFEDPIAAAKKAAAELRGAGADIVIAVTHMGSEPYCEPTSQTIAREAPGVDLIVDGHSHSKIALKIQRDDGSEALIVSAGYGLENLGRVEADRREGGGFTFSASLIPAESLADVQPDPAMRSAMEALKSELDKRLSQVVFTLPFPLEDSRGSLRSESAGIGRVVAAALAELSGADAGFINGGSIRAGLGAGEATIADILETLPFDNYVYVIEISGKDLLAALNHGLGLPGSGAFPQFWGLDVTAAKTVLKGGDGADREALAAESVLIGGQPVDEGAVYKLAINDFLRAGGDGYAMFTKNDHEGFGSVAEAFVQYINSKSEADLRAVLDKSTLTIK
jgi:2',3'-cyclic-nucleotide 2'-phosphodiesterase (5'-nucleotidase family)